MDDYRNKHIKITKNSVYIKDKINSRGYHTSNYLNRNYIEKLKSKNITKINSFSTMDIETIELNGNQHPICISSCSDKECKIFVIDHKLMKIDYNLAINNLFKEYFEYIINKGFLKIFIHNLGSFDGYFIYRYLLNYSNNKSNIYSLL